MRRSRVLAMLVLSSLVSACASDFHYEPAMGDPARPDAPTMTPPVVASPSDYTPPELGAAPTPMGDGMHMHHDAGTDDAPGMPGMSHEGKGGGR